MKTNRNWMKRAAMLSAMAACALGAQSTFAAKDDAATGADVHLEDAASLTPTPMPRVKATPKSSADTYEATGDLGITMRHGDTMRLYFDIDKAYTRITSARLVLYMWDVDYPSATEQDNVYFNGTYLGRLEGLNQGWDYNYFDVPISKITVPSSGESSSRNTVTIEVSVNPSGWVTRCGSAQLIINGDTFSLTASRNLTGGISVNWDNVYGSYDLWRKGPDDSDFTRIRQGITTNGCFDTDVQIGKPYTYYAMQSGAKSGGAKDATPNGASNTDEGLAGQNDLSAIMTKFGYIIIGVTTEASLELKICQQNRSMYKEARALSEAIKGSYISAKASCNKLNKEFMPEFTLDDDSVTAGTDGTVSAKYKVSTSHKLFDVANKPELHGEYSWKFKLICLDGREIQIRNAADGSESFSGSKDGYGMFNIYFKRDMEVKDKNGKYVPAWFEYWKASKDGTCSELTDDIVYDDSKCKKGGKRDSLAFFDQPDTKKIYFSADVVNTKMKARRLPGVSQLLHDNPEDCVNYSHAAITAQITAAHEKEHRQIWLNYGFSVDLPNWFLDPYLKDEKDSDRHLGWFKTSKGWSVKAFCDSLSNSEEGRLNREKGLLLDSAREVDTYNMAGVFSYDEYALYGDNELLARIKGGEYLNGKGVVKERDFAYPGMQLQLLSKSGDRPKAIQPKNDSEGYCGGTLLEWPLDISSDETKWFDFALLGTPATVHNSANNLSGASFLRFPVVVSMRGLEDATEVITNDTDAITVYLVKGYLADANGTPVAWTISNVEFTNTTVNVDLDFDGASIYSSHRSGFSLKAVEIFTRCGDVSMLLGRKSNLGSSDRVYSYSEFANSGMELLANESGDSMSADGLNVDLTFENATTDLPFVFEASLSATNGNEIIARATTTNVFSTSSGQAVRLAFPKSEIAASGIDGQYRVSSMTVSATGTVLTTYVDIYTTTNSYRAVDFLDGTECLSFIEGSAAFLSPAVAADGKLGKLPFVFSVMNGDSETIECQVAASLCTVSNKLSVATTLESVKLTNGMNEVSLSFSSSDIAAYGYDGPYKVEITVSPTGSKGNRLRIRPDVVTGEYKADDFGKTPVELVGTPLVNTSGSAPVVTLMVEGLRDCVYNASAVLLDSNREFVAYVVTTNTIAAGVTNTVTMAFDEAVIIASGHRGPYILDYVMLEPQNGADAAKLYSGAVVSDIDYTVADAYVDAVNGSDSNGGTSWSDAYQTIQAAVNVSMSGDTILVADGTYAPFQTGNKELTIQSRNGPAYAIIDGGGTNRCATLGTSAGHTNTVLRGFTLRNGNANGNAVTVSRKYGGGAYCGTIEGCRIYGNTASCGGGISYSKVLDSFISGNNATSQGGAIYLARQSYVQRIERCSICQNSSSGSPVQIVGNGEPVVINGCLIAENFYRNWLAVNDETRDHRLTITNTTIVGNSSLPSNTSGVGYATVIDSIVWDNFSRPYRLANHTSSRFQNSCTYPLPSGVGNIEDDPQFVDEAHHVYLLKPGSPCAGAATDGGGIGATGVAAEGGFVVGTETDGYGLILESGTVVEQGGTASFTAVEIGREFLHFKTNGVFATAEHVIDLTNIKSDILVTAVFGKRELFVDGTNGNDGNNGLSWMMAKKSISSAINDTLDYDTIFVTNGVYGPITPSWKKILIQSANGASDTIIDGGGSSQCINCLENGSGITNAVIVGFTLRNGFSTYYGGGVIGGVLRDCVIVDCEATTYGGGACNSYLENCVIARNKAGAYGGGTYYGEADHCTVCGNKAGSFGGGSYYGMIRNCIVSKNVVGGSEANWSNGTFDSCCTYPDCGSNPIEGDPMLVDGWNGDARLRVGSSCIVNGVQVCGAYIGEPVEGVSVSVGIQGTGSVSNETILVLSGGTATIEAVETVRPFLYWDINGERIEDRIYTLTNVTEDVRAIAVFGTYDWYVDAEYGDDANDGSDWDTAKRTLQAAVDAAVDDETIYVEAGTYGPISTDNKRIRIESMNGAEMTFIDGGGTNRCATLGSTFTHTNSALIGFTLLNGYSSSGGGSCCGALEYCVISNCVAFAHGDAYGGGAYYGNLNNCLVAYNCATSSNYAVYGGGTYCSTLRNCTVARNRAETPSYVYGGGSYGGAYSALNSIIWGNEAEASAVYGENAIGIYLYYCCTDATADLRYSGTITNDPQFVNADAGDFHLKVGSPCANTGYDWFVQGDMDLDWDDRIQGTRVDMGCYEGAEYAAPPGQATGLRAVRGVLTWDAMSDADGFMVYRSTRRAASSAKYIGMSDTNTYTDETAAEGTTYYYWVTAFNTLGTGTRSELAENLWIDPLAIVTASLPDGRMHDEYSVQLQATGGASPLRWEAVVPSYAVSSNDYTFATTGTAKGWYADDNYWTLALPFDFPFYGRTYRTAYVSSNGTISFGQGVSSTSYFSSTFLNNAMIAVLWKDLSTDGSGDIFVTPGETSVTIRWSAVYLGGNNEVNFSATLHADGRIVLSYGDGNTKGGMCGISAGDGERGIIARNNSTSWSNAKDIVFADGGYAASPEGLPDGLMLFEDGVLSGVATKDGSYAFYVRVTDAMGDSQVAEFQLEIEKNPIALHVDATNGDDANGGLSIESAKRSLQRAIDFALDDDTILVAPGVYEPISTGNKRIRIESVNGARTTFIDGGGTNRCATLGTTTNSVLAGFTLLNGRAPLSGSYAYGGGSYYGTLERCIISNCVANGYYAYGGGAYYGYLNNCLVAYNCATSSSYRAYGGGTYGSYLRSTTIARNRAIGMNAAYYGGAYGDWKSAYNSIIWDNEVRSSNASSAYYPNMYATYLYCCCTDGTASYRYSGTITNDPQFVDADTGDFRLSVGSPCLDAGDNSYAFEDKDISGNSRIVDTAVDMGCYEGSVYNVQPGLVTGEPLAITTTTLPDAMEKVGYSAQLEASGGTEPYFWEAVSKGYAYSRADNSFENGGESQEWGSYWTTKCYTLPFGFTFYGKTYDEVYVNENGTLSFGKSFTTTSPTWWEDYLDDVPFIAPEWDWTTSSSNMVYVSATTDAITFSWDVESVYGDCRCAFSVTLQRDGTIRFSYGEGKSSYSFAGVSAGDGVHYAVVATRQSGGIGNWARDVVLTPCYVASAAEMPNGLVLDSSGLLHGTMTMAWTNSIAVRVRDAAGAILVRELPFTITANPNRRPAIENVTPTNAVTFVKVGDSRTFSVIASDPEGTQLSYRWEIDGESIAGADVEHYTYSPSAEDAGEVRVLTCFVSDDLWTDNVLTNWTVKVPRTIYVDAASTNNEWDVDGSSPESAYLSLSRALDYAELGDTILVAPGVYEDYLDFRPYGIGYGEPDAFITVKGMEGASSTVLTRTLSNYNSNGWQREDWARYYNGRYYEQTPLPVLEGFTLRCREVWNLSLVNCIVKDVDDGTGMYGLSGCRLSDCIVTGCRSSDQLLRSCELTRCTVAGNRVPNDCFAIGEGSLLIESIVYENADDTGAMANYNPKTYQGRAWEETEDGYREWTVDVPCVVFTNSCTYPLPTMVGGGGNIADDPRLVDAANGDLRLRVGSPCIVDGIQTMGAYLGEPVAGAVVAVRVEGHGAVSPMTTVVSDVRDVTFDVSDFTRQFVGFYTNGVFATSAASLVWRNISEDGIVTAVFSNYTFHVDATTGSDANDGLSWTTAKASIQAAVGEALDGEVVYVKAGTYTPINSNGKRICIESVDGRSVTIIDGGGTNRCATLGSTTNTLVRGFRLTNGMASDGGAAYYGSLEDCDVVGNVATRYGGGLYYSVAIRCRIMGNIVQGSSWYARGGGAYYGMLRNCLVVGNAADCSDSGNGGGTYYGTHYNCTIVSNSVSGTSCQGGGAYGGTHYNTIVYGNLATNVPNEVNFVNAYNSLVGIDPLFADSDYRPAAGSLCIDSGNNSYVIDDIDLDGNARLQHYTVDIGCYEYALATPERDAGADFAAQMAGTCYGVFVGVGRYTYTSSLTGPTIDATNMQARCITNGYWYDTNTVALLDTAATKNAVRAHLFSLAAKAVSGDTVLYYQSSHGGNNYDQYGNMTKDTCICLHDETYEDYEMAEDLMQFAAGVKVVIVLDTCHSAGMFKAMKGTSPVSTKSFALRVRELMSERAALRKGAKSGIATDDIGWIAAADYNQYSWDSARGGAFTVAMLDGWKTGAADYDGDKRLNFHELWRYAKGIAVGYGGSDASDAQCLNEDVLLSRFAGTPDSSGNGDTTETTPAPVEHVWLDAYPEVLAAFGGDYEAMASAPSPGASGGGKTWPDGSPYYVWQDFVAGTSPTNDTVFTATIRMEGNTPVVTWEPDTPELRATRVYRTLGKKTLLDANWTDITDKDQSEYHFFRVTVDMP